MPLFWRLRNFLFVLFRPDFWLSNHSTNWEWDYVLYTLLQEKDPVRVSDCFCTINGEKVWIANYPYAYGRPGYEKTLPSPLTRRLLKKKFEKGEEIRRREIFKRYVS